MDRFVVDADYCIEVEEEAARRKKRRVKRKKQEVIELTTLNALNEIQNVKLIEMSLQVQQALNCNAGSDVTSQNPWKYLSKAALLEYIEAQDGMSPNEFDQMRSKIQDFPSDHLLLCYRTDEDVDFDQFYICLTADAEAEAVEVMETINREMEARLDSAINKAIRPWKSRGSENEVDLQLCTNNRPLLEMEFETKYPIMSAKSHFKLRMVEDARDGYINILPGRSTYDNIIKRRIDACVQASLPLCSNSIQTISTFPKNMWTQYQYEYTPILKFSKEFRKNIIEFMDTKLDYLDDLVHLNSFVNFYTNDYQDLVKTVQDTRYPNKQSIKEIFAFVDQDMCRGKTITAVSWHYMWTGTVAIAYSNKSVTSYFKGKNTVDEVTDAIYNVAPVLLWCFNDYLSPKLYLETPREVSAVSFCPYNENLLVGGCINGQVVIWDITKKIERVEVQEILTSEQQNYRVLMNSLIPWMKNTKDIKVVRPVVVSNLTYSHKSRVMAINWLSSFREISKSGQIKEITEEENRKSLQFLTTSMDGTVLAWDLNVVPTDRERAAAGVPRKRRSRLKDRPAGLVSDVSPLQHLHRILKPIFKVNIQVPGSTRLLPLTNVNILVSPPIQYQEKSATQGKYSKLTDRLFYEPIFKPPTNPLVNEFLAGSAEGDFLTVSWEGFAFNSGETVNKDIGKIEHFSKFHDGPVVSLSRSTIFPDLILTVGGKVFAVWMLKQLDTPVVWRRSRYKYTSGVWNTYRPSMIRLTRSDGYIERWLFRARSNRFYAENVVSGGYLGGTFTHPFKLRKQVIAVSDYNGSLRLFTIPGALCNDTDEQNQETYDLMTREVDRKLKFRKWQSDWNMKHAETIRIRKEEEEIKKRKLKEQEDERQARILEEQKKQQKEEVEREVVTKAEKWRLEEQKRMQGILLEKRELDIDVLKKLQVPLLVAQKEDEEKKIKLKEVLKGAQDMFSAEVQKSFPDVVEIKSEPPADPYAYVPSEEVQLDIYKNYLEVRESSKALIEQHKFEEKFDWLKMLKKGKQRRRILDRYYTRPNHRNRLIQEELND